MALEDVLAKLTTEPAVARCDRRCGSCGVNIPAGRYFVKITSDLDPENTVRICLACHTGGQLTQEKICKAIDKAFPNFARECRAQLEKEKNNEKTGEPGSNPGS